MFQYKDALYQDRNSHYKDKKVSWLSYLYDVNPFT